jgi:putative colanic acid biosynthesis UDP-glucose lipid carrier transferase
MPQSSDGLLRPHGAKVAFLHRILDAVTILLTLSIALFFTHDEAFNQQYALAGSWAVLLFLGTSGVNHLYGSWRMDSLRSAAVAVLSNWFWTALLLVFFGFLTKTSSDYSRTTIGFWFVLAPLFLVLSRVALHAALSTARVFGRNTRTFAIAGRTKLGLYVAEKISKMPWLGLQFVGYFDARDAARDDDDTPHHLSLTGSFDQLVGMARAGKIDYIYITLPMRAENRIVELANALSDTTASVYMVPNLFVFDLMQSKISTLDGLPMVSLHETPFYGIDSWVKRVEDVLVASTILLFIALPMLLIAMGVKLTSPGPVLFKQRRYGLNGAVVEVWKFRSMSVAEDGAEVTQATKNDPRVTPFGAFLRRTSLDELPQFFNVLQGTMSVVGPRPHAIAHNEQYRGLVRGYMLRHKVRPGITGLAQVRGWRGETETLEKMTMRVRSDLEYVEKWSLWIDVKIILQTVFKGFFSKNAY